MKYLVLFYDKSKTFPQTKTFDVPEAKDDFIQHKLNAGITCYEYNFSTKYSIEQKVIKSQL